MKLTKVKPSTWNGVGFGTSTALWSVSNAREWLVSSQSGNWYAVNTETGVRLWSFSRHGLLEKLNDLLRG